MIIICQLNDIEELTITISDTEQYIKNVDFNNI